MINLNCITLTSWEQGEQCKSHVNLVVCVLCYFYVISMLYYFVILIVTKNILVIILQTFVYTSMS